MIASQFEDICNTGNEVMLYIVIEELQRELEQIEYDIHFKRRNHDSATKRTLQVLQERIEYAVDRTNRFGVDSPRDAHGKKTQDFYSWFGWWFSYCRSLQPDEISALHTAVTEHQNVVP